MGVGGEKGKTYKVSSVYQKRTKLQNRYITVLYQGSNKLLLMTSQINKDKTTLNFSLKNVRCGLQSMVLGHHISIHELP